MWMLGGSCSRHLGSGDSIGAEFWEELCHLSGLPGTSGVMGHAEGSELTVALLSHDLLGLGECLGEGREKREQSLRFGEPQWPGRFAGSAAATARLTEFGTGLMGMGCSLV